MTALETVGGLVLSEIQIASLTRLAESTAPTPEAVSQDERGVVSLTWNTVGYRVSVRLKRTGQIESGVTVRDANIATLAGLLQFQAQLQELFAI